MGKKNTTKQTKPKIRNKKILPREHWKFKNNSRINKRMEEKQKKIIKELSNKNNNKENTKEKNIEDEIKLIENENNLFDEKGYYNSKEITEEEKNLINWEENEEILKNIQKEDLIQNMNKISSEKLDPKIIETYKLIGDILKKYSTGKFPKSFNILTMTENWEELLNITEPFNWTPAAMYEATIKFSSSEVLMTNIFYEKYLLPAIRNDIKIHKKLNVHYYNCLKKCIFKPSAFFKGIIFPLSKNLSSKEAAIIGSILRKCSIPVNHSSAALIELIKLCKNGTNGISFGALFFMKILLMKKYAFPIFVKEEICKFLLCYDNFNQKLPVMFHQVFLIFVQIYKLNLTQNEKNSLKKFNEKNGHYAIQNEINKELNYNNNNNNNNKMQIE
jgi:essential nuclear protein 1